MEKVVTLEVEVTLPKSMNDETLTESVDHMLDVGGDDMLDNFINWPRAPEVDPEIAKNCVQMAVGNSKVVDSSESCQESGEQKQSDAKPTVTVSVKD